MTDKKIISFTEAQEKKEQELLQSFLPPYLRGICEITVAKRPDVIPVIPPWLMQYTSEEIKPISRLTPEEAKALSPRVRKKLIQMDEAYSQQWEAYEKTGNRLVFWPEYDK